MKKKLSLFLAFGFLSLHGAWAGVHYGLGTAVAHQSAVAIDAANDAAIASQRPVCTDAPYTVSPLDLTNGFNLEPLGHLAPYSHTLPTEHIYFLIVKSSADTTSYDVRAPADILITRVSSSELLFSTPTYKDYSIYYDACRGVNGYFHHVLHLSADLEAKLGNVDRNCSVYSDGSARVCNTDTAILVNAGDVIGNTVGRVGSNLVGVDFGTHDYRKAPLAFADPSRKGADQLHTVCPVDYFPESLRVQMEARLGTYDGSVHRTAAPVCGEYNQDIAGSAQGNWYVNGTPPGPVQQENATLALVHDNVDPTRGVLSVGQSVTASGLSSGPYYFTPSSMGLVNRDFGGVRDTDTYCYESPGLISAVILIQMPNSTTLKIERQGLASCGAGPWSLTSNATTFVR